MSRFLIGVALFLIVALALTDAIWPAERPLLIDAASSAGQAAPVHPAGGEWCDVNHPPRPQPRVKGLIEPPVVLQSDSRSIA